MHSYLSVCTSVRNQGTVCRGPERVNQWVQTLRVKLLLGHSVLIQGDWSAVNLWAVATLGRTRGRLNSRTVAAVLLGLVRGHCCHEPVAASRD